MRRQWIFAAAVVAAIAAAVVPALAQAVEHIVAVVNADIVSEYDLQNRINLFIATANVPDTPEARQQLKQEVLQTLINDRLKSEEARRLNITVSQEELDKALTQIAGQLHVAPDQLKSAIEKRGAKLSTLIEQVETEIAWNKTVRKSEGSQITIGEDEIDAEAARQLEASSGPEYRVADIFLPVDSRADDASVQAHAQRLIEQLRQGASFPTLARTFSEGPAAAAGGDLGWVHHGQLPAELDKYLDELNPGEMIGPLKTAEGYHLLLMVDKRPAIEGKEARALLTMLQVFAPLPATADGAHSAAEVDQLRRLGDGAGSCAEVERRNRALKTPLPTKTAQVALRDLPTELRSLVAPMKPGDAAGPLPVNNGLLLLVLCDRGESTVSPEMREAIRQRLLDQRLSEAARGLLRDLRRKALIDIRS